MEDAEERNMVFTNKIQMTVPERITLSAGYDGDDNQDIGNHNSAKSSFAGEVSSFDETPLVNPDLVMAGMPTPPSVLTIDHSLTSSFVANSPNWHSEGDGAVEDENETSLQKYTRLRGSADTTSTTGAMVYANGDAVHGLRGSDIAGCSGGGDMGVNNIPFDDPHAMQVMLTSMQQRLNLLENEVQSQYRWSSWYRWFLLALTISQPYLYRYLFGRHR